MDCPKCEIPEQTEKEEFNSNDSKKVRNQRTPIYENHNEETFKLERRIDEIDKDLKVVNEDNAKLDKKILSVDDELRIVDEWACENVKTLIDNVKRLDVGLCNLQAIARNNDDFKMEIVENIQNLQEKDVFEDRRLPDTHRRNRRSQG